MVDVGGSKVATGDSHGNVYVWCAVEKTELMKLPSKSKHDAQGGIIALSFSRSCQYLVSVGGDADHKIVVWDWYVYMDIYRVGRRISMFESSGICIYTHSHTYIYIYV